MSSESATTASRSVSTHSPHTQQMKRLTLDCRSCPDAVGTEMGLSPHSFPPFADPDRSSTWIHSPDEQAPSNRAARRSPRPSPPARDTRRTTHPDAFSDPASDASDTPTFPIRCDGPQPVAPLLRQSVRTDRAQTCLRSPESRGTNVSRLEGHRLTDRLRGSLSTPRSAASGLDNERAGRRIGERTDGFSERAQRAPHSEK
jgi:hypothetical protein